MTQVNIDVDTIYSDLETAELEGVESLHKFVAKLAKKSKFCDCN